MTFLSIEPGYEQRLTEEGVLPEQVHLFDEASILAVNTALAAHRPLLVRGEPGAGKTQLAAAVARVLKRTFVPFVVDARTEAFDLLWEFDAVARLAEAQLAGALGEDVTTARNRLALANYLKPGPLWWAFDWEGAVEQAGKAGAEPPEHTEGAVPANGAVVLIDEIDKAESDVPNGLLEALGARQFRPHGRGVAVTVTARAPLIIITSNEERMLPDAFVRRCLVHHIELEPPGDALMQWLTERGQVHFPNAKPALLEAAAVQVSRDRQIAIDEQRTPRPGQAEYLDLVRAVIELKPDDPKAQCELLERIGDFALKKHRGAQ